MNLKFSGRKVLENSADPVQTVSEYLIAFRNENTLAVFSFIQEDNNVNQYQIDSV